MITADPGKHSGFGAEPCRSRHRGCNISTALVKNFITANTAVTAG
jgi:hypothetical protein